MVQIPENITTSFTLRANTSLLAEAETQYQADGTGPLSQNMTSSYVTERPSDAFVDSINATFHKALPKDRPILFYQYTTSPMVANPQNANVISGTDYRDAPLIFSNYWGSDADLALELYGYKKLRSAMASNVLAPIVQGELFPGPQAQTDYELIQAMLSSAWPFHHPSGTCSPGKVVDSRFHIPEIEGLRVIDSSVLPSQPTSHMSGPVYAVAELAAQMIQEDWDCRTFERALASSHAV
ncbi:GMC oxidoreductase-domain-containing protein [Aspergillus aurantiobrunneus]